MRDHHKAHLDPPTRALLDYAEKLTVAPSTMGREDIAALRAAGLSDEQILDATLIACMFNFMDRLADGLGVEIPAPRLNLLRRAWGADPATESPPDKIRS